MHQRLCAGLRSAHALESKSPFRARHKAPFHISSAATIVHRSCQPLQSLCQNLKLSVNACLEAQIDIDAVFRSMGRWQGCPHRAWKRQAIAAIPQLRIAACISAFFAARQTAKSGFQVSRLLLLLLLRSWHHSSGQCPGWLD